MVLRRFLFTVCLFALLASACVASPYVENPPVTQASNTPPPPTLIPTETPTATAAPRPLVPNFEHIVIVVLENKEFGTVIQSPKMRYFNELAKSYTLLTQHYAVTHPSLPNYLALIGGDTFGVTFDCDSCIYDARTLPDQIEASGRTWKTYQEDMPSPCYPNPYAGDYAIKHNPFMYFKSIRLDASRCARSVVPYTQLSADLAAGALPNFIFVTPNLCNDAHDCEINITDDWLKTFMSQLQPALDADGKPYLVIITWDEGVGKHSCCGLPEDAGGRIATILISPQAKNGFQDDTPYTHYSILKTIEQAWGLPYLGHAADESNVLITAPWK